MQGTREGVGEMSLEMHVGAGHPGTWQPWQGVEVSLWHRVCHFGQVFSDSWDDPEIDTRTHKSRGNDHCSVPSHLEAAQGNLDYNPSAWGRGSLSCYNHLFLPP